MAFCRSCGGDIQIVSQAIKKHSPVALISKLDAAIERKDERLRRDSIFCGVSGILFAILIPLISNSWPWIVGSGLLAVFLFYNCVLNYLAFRRCRETRPYSEQSGSSGDDRIGPTTVSGKVTGLTEPSIEMEYCPKCGTSNADALAYCVKCGFQLNFTAQELNPGVLRSFLSRKVDSLIEKNDKGTPQYKSALSIVLVSIYLLFLGVSEVTNGNVGIGIFLLFSGIGTFFTGGWDLIAYRRTLEYDPAAGSVPSLPTDLLDFGGENLAGIAAAALLILVGFLLFNFGFADPLGPILSGLGVITGIALILKFNKFYRQKRDEFEERLNAASGIDLQTENDSAAETARLEEGDLKAVTAKTALSEFDEAETRELTEIKPKPNAAD